MLAEKPFEALSLEERNLVLENMDENEYESLRTLLIQSRRMLKKSPPPDPAIRENLLAAIRRQKAMPLEASLLPRNIVMQILKYRIPVWQAAATVTALMGFLIGFKQTPLSPVKTEKVYVYVTDTIYKEVSLPGMDTAVNSSPNRVNVKPGQWNELNGLPALDSSARKFGETDLADSLTGFQIKRGRQPKQPMNKEGEAWRFPEEMN